MNKSEILDMLYDVGEKATLLVVTVVLTITFPVWVIIAISYYIYRRITK